MLTALYHNHHGLPFWRRPANPFELFTPKLFDKVIYYDSRTGTDKLVNSHSFMNVLLGIHQIELPNTMAYISIGFIDQPDKDGKTMLSFPKRIWIQFTSIPKESETDKLPVVVKDEKVQVSHIWGRDNGTYHPFELPGTEKTWAELSQQLPEFWSEFFLNKIKESTKAWLNDAQEKLTAAEANHKQAKKLYQDTHGIN